MANDSDDAPEALRLRIPEPARGHRPADLVRFVSKAGEMKRPALDEKVERVALMRKQLVRVLDDDGQAVGEWVPELSVDDKLAGLRDMMTVRSFDARMLRAHRQGKISFYMQSLGEEAIACAQQPRAAARRHALPDLPPAGTADLAGVSARRHDEPDPLERAATRCKGRQLPVLYSSKAHGFFSISGNLATQFIQAVGWAMASALRGGTEIASAWIGEGATAESDFHAALVFASTYQAPVILNIVNNHWAISTPEDFARGASATFADRGLRLQHPGAARRRQRLPRRARGVAVGGRAGPCQPRPDADRVGHAPRRRALHVRRPVGLPTRPTRPRRSRSAIRSTVSGST